MIKKIDWKVMTIVINLVLLSAMFGLADNLLEGIFGNFRLGHVISIVLCPIVAIIGGYISFKEKNILFTILNLVFIFTYPITSLLVTYVLMP